MTYEIKRLEWEKTDSQDILSMTGVHSYTIYPWRDKFSVDYQINAIADDVKTIEKAKEIAQKHFEKEIMQYLNVSGEKK